MERNVYRQLTNCVSCYLPLTKTKIILPTITPKSFSVILQILELGVLKICEPPTIICEHYDSRLRYIDVTSLSNKKTWQYTIQVIRNLS